MSTHPKTSSDGAAGRILTINGGSSSIKFAVFTTANPPTRLLSGTVERIGSPQASLTVSAVDQKPIDHRTIGSADHEHAAEQIADWISTHDNQAPVIGVGHRIVHGGIHLLDHQLITDKLLRTLDDARPLDPNHLPREIALIKVFRRHFADVPQVACFDSAFHKTLPRVAKLLPIPRPYDQQGIRRLGFHGLSFTYLIGELRKIAPREAAGRVILAHLGSGASLAAVHDGHPIDTTMAFTPTAGLVMGTRPGDFDPGLLVYLMRRENKTPDQMYEWISTQCGLLGVSETSSDMRDLIAKRDTDPRAAEAVDLFCYQARKFIGAYAAAMGGLDAIVFAGGIGEHSPQVRAGICQGLDFLGLTLDPKQNDAGAPVISTPASRIVIRVIPTDEEITIAQIVEGFLRKE